MRPDDRMEAMKSMNFRRIFFLGVLVGLGCATVAQAQFAAYGMVNGERLKGITCLDPAGVCAASNGTFKPYGGTVGVFYDWRSFGPLRLGIDARGTFLDGNKSAYSYMGGSESMRHNAALGGLRATFKTPFHVLRPYVQASAGLGRTDATAPAPAPLTTLFYRNFTQVEGFAGLDLALFNNIDLRVIELGAGEIFGPSSHSIQSIGIGIVFHPTRER
jgi:hypothetical protein